MSWIFSFFISIRQFAYTLVCFLTQPKLIEYAYQVITFKACRGKGPSKNGSISSLNSMIEKAAPILQENEKNETNENNENHENIENHQNNENIENHANQENNENNENIENIENHDNQENNENEECNNQINGAEEGQPK